MSQQTPGAKCPACMRPLRDGQQWCLECGAAARTRFADARRPRVTGALAVAVTVCALGALLFAAGGGLTGSGTPAPSGLGAHTAGATGASGTTAP